MGALISRHLDAKDRKYLAGHTAGVLRDFSSHLHLQLNAALLEREQSRVGLRDAAGTQAVLQQHDTWCSGEALLEGTVLQYAGGSWRQRLLQVTKDFAVESRDCGKVSEGGRPCGEPIVLSGSQICTSVQEHCVLLDAACQHITGGRRSRMPFWNCPTQFPVFVQHPYRLPQCLCANSREAQLLWASVLQRALQRHSTVLQGSDTLEAKAILEAMLLYKQQCGTFHCGTVAMGTKEEILASLVMEEVLPYLQDHVFPRKIMPQSWRRIAWMKFLAAAYDQVFAQVGVEMTALMETWARECPLLEKQVRADLHEITALQDSISRKMTEDLRDELSLCLCRDVAPLLLPTVQVVATPTCSGFSAARQLFLEVCEDMVSRSSSRASLHELLSPLCKLGSGSARVSQYLALLELSAGGQAWLRTSWGICAASCRAAVLRAQSTLQQLVDVATETFKRAFSCQFNPSLDQLHISAMVQRVRDHLLKQLDHDLRNTQYQLILECVLQLSLPRLVQSLGQQDLSRYEQLVYSEYALFLHPRVLYHRVLRDHLSREIREVMNHSLPRHCIPLPARRLSDCVSEDEAPPNGRSQACTRLSPSASVASTLDSYENIQD